MANKASRKAQQTKYIKRLTGIFAGSKNNKQKEAALLIKRAAFLMSALDELENYMQTNGYIGIYTNGANQQGTTASAALKSYNIAAGQLLNIFKQLNELTPDDNSIDELQAFMQAHAKK